LSKVIAFVFPQGKGGNKHFQSDKPEGFLQAERTLNFHLLPKTVKRRVYALKRLQLQSANIEAKFYEEVHELERKYAGLYQPNFDKRRDIVAGAVEPTDEECEWQSDREEEELAEDLQKKAALEEKQADSAGADDPRGVPEFWLTIFKRVDMLAEMLQEHDEPILKHLQDITVKFSEPGQPMSFTLEFYFEPNSYFSNTVLTKVYKMKSEPDAEDPFSFEGPEIIDCEGLYLIFPQYNLFCCCGIFHFFVEFLPELILCLFFSFLASPDGMVNLDFTLTTDFEIGHFFRERVIPRAVLYFTGEALEDDESDLDDEGEEEDEGDFDPTVSI
uniref:Nucleosome assembly protein 1-like 4a n=1 Tax=Cyprinus carpio TaxID=7962 RepID=A0A8C1X7C8_CYPCA